jgi:hypothetical protein
MMTEGSLVCFYFGDLLSPKETLNFKLPTIEGSLELAFQFEEAIVLYLKLYRSCSQQTLLNTKTLSI